ncbi:MAG: vitamin B12-dependent ribonucleotide reductase [Halanaerobium sp.]|nr:vitamin B12-dependent ribonucleotide reductase [Halanaerobium sp.]
MVAKLTPNARKVLESRYLTKGPDGELKEAPEEMFQRVAENIALASEDYQEDSARDQEAFFELMSSLDFLPNSPTLMNAGNELQQLSACFVLPVQDSMEGIFEAVKNAALIHKSGGGTGFSFSRLRPKNDPVRSTGGVASGPISFMEVFDAATNTVKQGGKRRGANMGILRVDHPDIIEFITCKEDERRLNNFNISVGITEKFMEAVKEDEPYELIHPKDGSPVKELRAREVFDLIVEMAHKNGEPGIVFLDRINQDNPTPQLGEIESTNPCGEQPLLPFEACNLGSINLSHMTKTEDGETAVAWDKLEETVRTAVRFLDNVIDMNEYPLDQIAEMVRGNRKIGLGVMGWADMLFRLGVPYNSEEAIELAEKLMKFIDDTALAASRELAEARGSFPNIEGSLYSEPLRNATRTTIAPTGSISIIANTSSGVEPLFALAFKRNVIDDTLLEVHPIFEQVAKERGFYSEGLMEKISKEGSIANLPDIPEDIKEVFVTAHEITPEWHIKMQAAFQKYTNNAVSKTVNFPNQATEEDIASVFLLAYQLGCKGVTVYRDGSRSEQVLETGRTHGNKTRREKRPRPQITIGTTEKTKIGCGKLYITINSDEQGICEVFTSTGRGGGCRAQSEATSRLISLALRSGVPIEEIIHQLKGIRCAAAIKRQGVKNVSCPDAIARAISRYLELTKENPGGPFSLFQDEEELSSPDRIINNDNGGLACPDCGNEMEHEGGCVVCRNCGYSKCG